MDHLQPLRQQYLSKARRVVLKLGSVVLTAAHGLNQPLIQRLVGEIGRLGSRDREFILVSSGAIAAGCRKLGFASRPAGIPQAQAVAAAGQSVMMHTYEEAFAEIGLKVAQILLTHDDLESRDRFLNARNTLFTLLGWEVVPIINENDTVVTDELKFGDNDNLAALICNLVGADLLVLLTDIDGLFDQDPREHADARLLHLVPTIDADIEKAAGHRPGALGRGGMVSKLQAAKKAGAAGLPTLIANGLTPGILEKIFAGHEVGTLFLPQDQKLTSRQYWLAYNVTPKGAILVDPGAREALVARPQEPAARRHPGGLWGFPQGRRGPPHGLPKANPSRWASPTTRRGRSAGSRAANPRKSPNPWAIRPTTKSSTGIIW